MSHVCVLPKIYMEQKPLQADISWSRRLATHPSYDKRFFMFQTGNKHSAPGQHPVTWNPMDSKDHKTLKLKELYKNGSNATKESNTATVTVGTNNVTST